MWKYVAFVVLIILCVPAVFGAEDGNSSDTTIADIDASSTIILTTVSDLSSSDVPSTTPSAPTTSSDVPSTTPSAPTTSSDVPTAPPSVPTTPPSTSTAPVTTVSPPTTTALPPPDVGKYAIQDKDDVNKTCIRAEMALRIEINGALSNFPQNASTDGSDCNASDTQILKLTHQDVGYSLTFIFVQDDKKTYAQNISFSYSPSETVKTSGHFFSASKDKSYLCNSDAPIKMENVTLIFSSVHIQAYGTKEFNLAEECDADDKVGDIVPIAVGCALGALVVIVLIAYLVGRRRSRQRGYQSV